MLNCRLHKDNLYINHRTSASKFRLKAALKLSFHSRFSILTPHRLAG
ncbi:hypothetical protein AVDCRST_MAG92-449 [uncultured Coleofasciculus sp.]|uniref:Uncharacterized protein n=1 Tax=uncultured Coleofasciculus sp. TaxID=1267456 RepID=A0A6J4HCF3_9CYAN|nr:hypothetical protein AVDCRST_MAG92-449 [uncultured Coleofasciculus sp.]